MDGRCLDRRGLETRRSTKNHRSESPKTSEVAEPKVVLYDFGAKRNIMRHLAAEGMQVMVVPADTPAEQVLAMHPDGVMLSNGPGDPAGLPYAVEATRQLIAAGVPIFGICLGHQLIGRALGGTTSRLKFGHHGGNHPVQDLRTGKVYITAQNHNYQVDTASLNSDEVEITHLSLNDGSLEGLRLQAQAGLLRAVSPGGRARTARCPRSVWGVHGVDPQATLPLMGVLRQDVAETAAERRQCLGARPSASPRDT